LTDPISMTSQELFNTHSVPRAKSRALKTERWLGGPARLIVVSCELWKRQKIDRKSVLNQNRWADCQQRRMRFLLHQSNGSQPQMTTELHDSDSFILLITL